MDKNNVSGKMHQSKLKKMANKKKLPIKNIAHKKKKIFEQMDKNNVNGKMHQSK